MRSNGNQKIFFIRLSKYRANEMKLVRLLTILFVCLCYPQSAIAYLDPGTGSLILQMLIAGIIGAMYTIKLYWYRLKTLVAQIFSIETKPENSQDDDNSPDQD